MRALALSFVAFAFFACAATSDPLCANDVCTAGADGGDIPNGPDECASDPTAASCTTESSALFVKTGASSVGADGSKARPYATINDAVNHVTSARRRVYVCTGAYQAPVVVKSGASIYGGLDCDWNKGGAHPTIVNNQGPAVTIKDAQFVVFADISISANAASSVPGDSAIGMFISSSSNVMIQRVDIVTGNGIEPTPAPAVAPPNYTTPAATSGGNAGTPNGGAGAVCKCQDLTSSSGGNGGTFNVPPPEGAGLPGTSMPPVGTPNGAGTALCPGLPGADGTRPEKVLSTSTLGAITKDGWVPSTTKAARGVNGRPGQGGGGAGASNPDGGSGGGCGGCGGTGGEGGGHGGSSFGVVLFQSSTVTILDSNIKTGLGADGGAGGAGESGQVGGDAGVPVLNHCKGGRGGFGSGGGGGTGGHGGHSIGIAYVGTIPFVTGGSTKTGDAGKGGKAGKGGADNGAQNGGFDGDLGTAGTKGDIVQLTN